jgi:hypothetical protein
MEYFSFLPQFDYCEKSATNIMVRAKVREYVLKNSAIFYTHIISENERPDSIASKYYGNGRYTWLLFYANNLFDPLFDWPLHSEEFIAYLENKVGSIQIAAQTPHHYLLDDKFVIDKPTFEDPMLPANRKRMVTVYEHEQKLNEKKREIKIIDKEYARQIMNEMKRLFK